MNILPRWQKGLRRLQTIAVATMLAGLAACQSSGNLGVPSGLPLASQNASSALSSDPNGQVIGQGKVRIALLVPSTAPGNAAVVAAELKNGALMAMQDFGNASLQLVVKDTQGQAANAQNAAREAIAEGTSLIIGPLFAANVSAASGMAIPSRTTVIAFSTDSSVARRGVYLLSFTPEDDSRRILTYAISLGKRSITAFLPDNAEGAIRENVLRQVAGAKGVATQIIKYARTPEGIEQSVTESATLVDASDTIYIPEGGPVPKIILTGLQRNGVNLEGKQILGSGAWESVDTSASILNGALYPGRHFIRGVPSPNLTSLLRAMKQPTNSAPVSMQPLVMMR